MTVDRTPAHLADMLQFVQEIRGLLADQPLEEFLANRVLCLATEKLFINLGEAASRIDVAHYGQMPNVPWRQVIGLRNILAHGYEQVEHETLFNTRRTGSAPTRGGVKPGVAEASAALRFLV